MNYHKHRVSSIENRESSYLRAYKALHLSKILYKSAIFLQNKPNFQKSQMNLSVCIIIAYENKSNRTLGENKPNQNQYKPNSNPIFKMPKMNVNNYYKIDYSNKTYLPRIENKPNQTQFVVSLSNLFQNQFLYQELHWSFIITGLYEKGRYLNLLLIARESGIERQDMRKQRRDKKI
jgi:hypothetical protein